MIPEAFFSLHYYQKNLAVLWIATFFAAASFQQVIPFLPLFLQQLGVTTHLSLWAGVVAAASNMTAIFFQPFWGRIADQYGRKPMMIRAGVCLGLIYFVTSMSTTPWHVALCRFLNGALTGFVPGAVALAATNTPKHLCARYVASLQTANAAGAILGPAIGGVLADLLGFRGALRVSGVVVLLCTLFVLVLVEEKEKTSTRPTTTLWQDTVMTLTHPVLFVVMVTVAFTAFATSAIQPMLAVYLASMPGDAAKWLSGVIFSLPGIAFVIMAGFWTRLGERKGFTRLIPMALVLSAVAAFSLSFAGTMSSFAILYFALGMFVAALRPSAAALIATRVEDSFQGMAFGMQQSAFTFGGFVGPVFSGVVGAATDTRWLFAWIGVVLTLSSVWLRRLIARWDESVSGQPDAKAFQQTAAGRM
jgi:DHA1 family multidrug resistance protein-like MFS transporter